MALDTIERSTLYRTAVMLAVVAIIVWGCMVVLSPFMPALMLAIILCLATWPAFKWLQAKLKGRNSLAAFLMTIMLALCFLAPLVFMGSSLADNFTIVYRVFLDALNNNDGQAPQWLAELPLVGPHLQNLWVQYMADTDTLTATLSGYAGPISQWFLGVGAVIGRGLLDLSLGVLITFFLFRKGDWAAARINTLTSRFAGERGQHLLVVSKQTMIGVVYGLLGTALAQGAVAGLGFGLAGVPGAPFLGLLTLFLSIIPFGPPLIWIPATVWLFMQGHIGHGVFMGIWGLVVISAIDNVVRPYFISLGSSLPLLLVLFGVFGGILAFGFIGLFIGPVFLALAYTLVVEWSHTDPKKPVLTPAPVTSQEQS